MLGRATTCRSLPMGRLDLANHTLWSDTEPTKVCCQHLQRLKALHVIPWSHLLYVMNIPLEAYTYLIV